MEHISIGKTVESAIEEGLKKKGWLKDEVKIEIVDEGKRGLFNKTPAVIKLIKLEREEQPSSSYKLNQTEDIEEILLKEISTLSMEKMMKPIQDTQTNHIAELEPLQSTLIEEWINLHISPDKLEAKIHLFDDKLLYLKENPDKHIPFTVGQISHFLKTNKINYGIDFDKILAWLSKELDIFQPCLIASGKPPIDGSPTTFIELYETTNQGQLDELTKEETNSSRINWFGIRDVGSVKKGQKILSIIPPTDGEEGIDVHGDKIEAKKGAQLNIRLGKGVEFSSSGNTVIASIDGIPNYSGQSISVNPLYIVQGDLTIEKGSLTFNGDILITGNVAENLSVQATGNIEIQGSVTYANIKAGKNVSIGKNIITSTIVAGGDTTFYQMVHGYLESIGQRLTFIINAYEQLNKSAAFTTNDLTNKGIGRLIRLLTETRLKGFEDEVRKFYFECIQSEDKLEKLDQWVKELAQKLTGFGPLRIQTIEEIISLYEMSKEISQEIQEYLTNSSDVYALYIHNSTIHASGNIYVKGLGVYNSSLVSGSEIQIFGKHGIVRGGTIQALNTIIVRELGGPASIKTVATVKSENGEIKAEMIYDGVLIGVGPSRYKVLTPGRLASFKYNKNTRIIDTIILKVEE